MKLSLTSLVITLTTTATCTAFEDLATQAREANEGFRQWREARAGRNLQEGQEEATIVPVYFHIVIEDENRGDDVPQELLEKQMNVLNDSFGGRVNSEYPLDCDGNPAKASLYTSFQFEIAGVTRTYFTEDQLATTQAGNFSTDFPDLTYPPAVLDVMDNNFTDAEMVQSLFLVDSNALVNQTIFENFVNKTRDEQFWDLLVANFLFTTELVYGRALRVGGCDTLNVVVLPNNKLYGTTFGFAQPPHQCKEGGVLTDADVVVVSRGAIAGSTFPESHGSSNKIDAIYGAEEGGTITHETGHWLGLYHPSNVIDGDKTGRNGCDYLTGDYVVDTPAQFIATNCDDPTVPCCPKGQDTCPHLPGLDPIENFMDYASDCCTNTFTPGQVDRMIYSWESYRETNGSEDELVELQLEDAEKSAKKESDVEGASAAVLPGLSLVVILSSVSLLLGL